VRTAAAGLVEALKPTVEDTGGTVTGGVEGAASTTCELAKLLCAE